MRQSVRVPGASRRLQSGDDDQSNPRSSIIDVPEVVFDALLHEVDGGRLATKAADLRQPVIPGLT
jgi:hypothetical protein